MGQGHLIANLDKREFILPRESGDGYKLVGFLETRGGAASGLTSLLCTDWAGDRVAIIGDYYDPAEDGDTLPGVVMESAGIDFSRKQPPRPDGRVYDLSAYTQIEDEWTEKSKRGRQLNYMTRRLIKTRGEGGPFSTNWDIDDSHWGTGDQHDVIVNLDSEEYIDPLEFGDYADARDFRVEGGGMTAGLVMLLAASNGKGGGDLEEPDYDCTTPVGRWAGGNRIAVMPAEDAEGMTNISECVRNGLRYNTDWQFRQQSDGTWDRREYGDEPWVSAGRERRAAPARPVPGAGPSSLPGVGVVVRGGAACTARATGKHRTESGRRACPSCSPSRRPVRNTVTTSDAPTPRPVKVDKRTTEWRLPDGTLHREGGPARTATDKDGNETEQWWLSHGRMHREGGPAYIRADPHTGDATAEAWFRDGVLHREGGPAVVDGDLADFRVNGNLDRPHEYGPARVGPYVYMNRWTVDGAEASKEKYDAHYFGRLGIDPDNDRAKARVLEGMADTEYGGKAHPEAIHVELSKALDRNR